MIITGVAISVIAVLAVGFVVSRKVDGDSANVLVAGRSLTLPLVAAGLMGQAVDANATLGNTDLAAGFGFWAGVSLPLGLGLCLLLTGLFFARRMNAMHLTTLPDFYRITYGRGVELLSSVLMIFAFSILLAGNLVAGGFLFEAFLDTSYEVGVVLIMLIALSYTVAGGMFSDAYPAVLQLAITIVATAALLWWVTTTYGLSSPEGLGPFDLAQLGDPGQGAVINWATLIALGVGDIVAIDFMQRVFSAKSPDVARRACFIGAAGTALIGIPYGLVAISTAEIFGDNPADGPVLFHLLQDYAPTGLAILVLSGIVAASCNTANGAILGTAAVAVRNIGNVRHTESAAGYDPQLRYCRIAMVPVVAVAVLLALRVPQTGILLVLAFDLMLACLAVPFILGVYGTLRSPRAALAALAVGFTVRMGFFVLTPTVYGLENTVLYVENGMFGPGFDGWPTFIALACSLTVFLAVARFAPGPRPTPITEDAPGQDLLREQTA